MASEVRISTRQACGLLRRPRIIPISTSGYSRSQRAVSGIAMFWRMRARLPGERAPPESRPFPRRKAEGPFGRGEVGPGQVSRVGHRQIVARRLDRIQAALEILRESGAARLAVASSAATIPVNSSSTTICRRKTGTVRREAIRPGAAEDQPHTERGRDQQRQVHAQAPQRHQGGGHHRQRPCHPNALQAQQVVDAEVQDHQDQALFVQGAGPEDEGRRQAPPASR